VIASSEQTIVIAEDPCAQKQERRQLRKMFRGGGGRGTITARPPALPPAGSGSDNSAPQQDPGSFSY